MTTRTMSKSTDGWWFIIAMCMLPLILLLFSWTSNLPRSVVLAQPLASDIRIFEVVSGHAWEMHGEEVNSAIRCIEDNGSKRAFKTSFQDNFGNSIPTNVWLCFDGKDWYAVISTTFQKIQGNLVARLVTAYKISKDIFPNIADFVNYIGLKWNAREIQYVIEAGQILLQPK